MKHLFVWALFFSFFTSCIDNVIDNKCRFNYIKINSTDSICLNIYSDVDTNQIKEIANMGNGKTLLIFTGFTIPDNNILSKKNLDNNAIVAKLKDISIIRLNVDNSQKRNKSDSLTIGNSNYQLQVSKFRLSTQPLHVFIDNNLKKVGNILAYSNNEDDILKFLNQ